MLTLMNAESVNSNDKTVNSGIRNENPDFVGKTVAESSNKFLVRSSTALCHRWWKFKKVNIFKIPPEMFYPVADGNIRIELKLNVVGLKKGKSGTCVKKSKMEKQHVNNVKNISSQCEFVTVFCYFHNNEVIEYCCCSVLHLFCYTGKMVRRARASAGCQEPESLKKAPHSFIFHRGRVGSYVRRLIGDLRKTFSPFSAAKLKIRKSNTLKDFVSIAGPLSVSHMLIFTRSESYLNMRLIRLPRGPTLMFRVLEYTLAKDVVSALRKSVHSKWQPNFAPLLIFNGFDNDTNNNVKLTHTMFQTMLPSLNVDSIKLNNIRRCVLFTYDKETEEIEFRQYAIKVVPSGVSKQAKVFLKNKVPDLGRHQDISDFFIQPQCLSESEQEGEVEGNVVELPQEINAPGCKNATEVAVRLIEMGPRLRMQLIKIEEGISNGPVLFNRFVQTSEGETNEEIENTSTTVQRETRKSISSKIRRRRRRRIKGCVKN
ncbi:Suppressor of SWI4 1 -like protein [Trichinella pseudospiralis]|uniref:Suppressor of SWI4 1-like protein n=1 Tax=Trichinella pseudospiralis TaxID=6337 RepID=A0A0V1JTU6_TRIPS|nr:Suppressor of SWI4 1 -like protein [Trichinella pseudospiralis]